MGHWLWTIAGYYRSSPLLRRGFLFISVSTLCLFPFTASAQSEGISNSLQAQENRPKVAVVLSGGGAKGVAHISCLRAIEQAGIPIDIITGTSMGSLIGGLYAVGWTTDQLDSLVRHQDWSFLLSDKPRPESLDLDTRRMQNTYPLWHFFMPGNNKNQDAGFLRGDNLDQLFDQLLTGYLDSISFDSLPIPFSCVATDIVTNNEVDFHSGYLKQALRASMSIPGVFSPVRLGDSVLVDGGLRNNYPADIARQMGADIIIGVTVQGDTLGPNDITSAIDVLMQIFDHGNKDKYRKNLDISDVVMYVDVEGFSAASFTTTAIDTLLRRGADEAARHWEELLALRRHHHIDSIPRGNRRPTINTTSSVQHSSLTPQHSSPTAFPIAGVAFRFDNEEAGVLQAGAMLPFSWQIPMQLSARLRLGKRIQFSLRHSLFPQGITSPSLAYTFFRNNIDLYDQGVRSYNIKFRQHRLDLAPINSIFRKYQLRAGLRLDHFHYTDPLLSAVPTTVTLENEHYFSYYLSADLNTENHWYFPSSGTRIHLSYAYRTTDFLTLHGESGLNDISAHWRLNVPLSSRLTLQSMLYGRILTSGEPPLAFSNIAGGEWFGHYIDQQLPFAGIGHAEIMHRHFAAAQLQLQYRFGKNNYILLRAAAAYNSDDLTSLSPKPDFYGLQLGYSYDSFFGPLSARVGYTTLSDQLSFYLSAGHRF